MADWQPASGGDTNPYCIEPAKSGRATCKKCKEPIPNKALRFGSPVEIQGNLSYHWNHWRCLTEQVLANMRGKIARHGQDVAIEGMDRLKPRDRERVQRALDTGLLDAHFGEVEEEGDEEAVPVKTPKKRTPKKAAATPRKKRGASKKAEGDEYDDDDAEDWVPGK